MNNTDLIFFTSDTHFGHRMMIDPRVGRPFADIDVMDEELIRRWNDVVPKNGKVFHLGDVSFRNVAATQSILGRLNGSICLVRGNHDHLQSRTLAMFEWVKDYYELKLGTQRLVLFHFPIRVWNQAHHGAWHLHGHSHGNLPAVGRMLDVGLDSKALTGSSHLRPFTYAEVADYMATREFVAEDHHQIRDGSRTYGAQATDDASPISE